MTLFFDRGRVQSGYRSKSLAQILEGVSDFEEGRAKRQEIGLKKSRPGSRNSRTIATVLGDTAAQRFYYITAYLDWLSDYVYLLRLPNNREEFRIWQCAGLADEGR